MDRINVIIKFFIMILVNVWKKWIIKNIFGWIIVFLLMVEMVNVRMLNEIVVSIKVNVILVVVEKVMLCFFSVGNRQEMMGFVMIYQSGFMVIEVFGVIGMMLNSLLCMVLIVIMVIEVIICL